MDHEHEALLERLAVAEVQAAEAEARAAEARVEAQAQRTRADESAAQLAASQSLNTLQQDRIAGLVANEAAAKSAVVTSMGEETRRVDAAGVALTHAAGAVEEVGGVVMQALADLVAGRGELEAQQVLE